MSEMSVSRLSDGAKRGDLFGRPEEEEINQVRCCCCCRIFVIVVPPSVCPLRGQSHLL